MVTDLRASVDALREALAAIDDAVTFADLPPGLDREPPAGLVPSLAELLQITDGPRCGSVVFFDADSIADNQFFAQELEGGGDRWLCFGTCDYVPLFADRRSDETYWSPEEDGTLSRLADDVLSFFRTYAIGPGYADITSADGDPWYEFLVRQGLVTQEENQ